MGRAAEMVIRLGMMSGGEEGVNCRDYLAFALPLCFTLFSGHNYSHPNLLHMQLYTVALDCLYRKACHPR